MEPPYRVLRLSSLSGNSALFIDSLQQASNQPQDATELAEAEQA